MVENRPVTPISRDRTTVRSLGGTAGSIPARYLLVAGDDRLVTVPLPLEGEVVLGRGSDATVELAHAKISRRHARVIVGNELRIEDLGSTNGIFVGGTRLERGVPAPLPIGE